MKKKEIGWAAKNGQNYGHGCAVIDNMADGINWLFSLWLLVLSRN